MLKKKIFMILIMVALSCSLSFSQEKLGQVIGKYEKTNEKISLNGVFLDLYNLNGKDAILIEELTYCGYDMKWDSKNRTTTFKENYDKEINRYKYNSMNKNVKGNIYSSDIKIYIEDRTRADKIQINAYNIGGYSLVYLDELVTVSGYTGHIQNIKLKNISGNIYLPNKEKAPKGGIDVKIQTYRCFTPYVDVVDEIKVHIKEGQNSAKYTLKGSKDYENVIYFFVLNTDKYYNSRDEQFQHSRTYEIIPDFNSIDIRDKVKQDILISRNSKLTAVIHLPEMVDKKSVITNVDTRELMVSAFYKDKSTVVTLKKLLDDKDIDFELNIPKDFNNGKFKLGVEATTYEGFSHRHYMGGPIMIDGYYKDGKLIDDIEKSNTLSINDLDNIDVNIDKPIGKHIGKVYVLKEKLGDEYIDVFNINGYLGVKASDLSKFGYSVDFDNVNKKLDIKSNNLDNTSQNTLAIKNEDLTMTWATYTDINTYLDGKKINGFNVDSSMVVLFDDLELQIDLSEHIVTFDDINLEKAIREIINKPKGDIYLSDLNRDDFKYVDLSSKNITNLSGIENISSIMTLNLNNNNIQDISCLSKLKELYSIELNNNKIENIYPLQKLSNLSKIKLSGNNISDISVLQNLNELHSIDLSNNNIKDIQVIGSLSNVHDINLSNNEIEDISSLSKLKDISTLNLNSNKIKDIFPLASIKEIKRLELTNNKIEDISALKNLNSLARLDLGSNNIKDISDIKGLINLYELTLNDNKIDNIEPLSNIQYLYKLYLSNNEIRDYNPVKNYYNKLEEKDF